MAALNKFLGLFLVFTCCHFAKCFENDRPIIGIFAEETGRSKFAKYGTSHIVAAYVKFLELGGARVVPIMIYQPEEYYQDLLGKINGVLFTGGGNNLNSDGYGRTGKIIFDIAVKLNKKKDYFPLWGTCLGFELFNYVVAQKSWMKACAAEDLPSPVNFVPGFRNSRMFQYIDDNLVGVMSTRNISINYHQWCLTPQNYSLSGLDKFYKVLSVSQDAKNLSYVSMIEAYEYPFYAVAFHPEKVLFEWVLSKTHQHIPHTPEAVKVSQYFANFFVGEARKNFHSFRNKTEELDKLIYNYSPIYTGKYHSAESQNYYFNVTKKAIPHFH